MPKFTVFIRATADSESGRVPTTAEFSEMMEFNQKLNDAGVLLGGEGLLDSSKGARVTFSSDPATKPPTTSKGPYPNLNELVAGYWIIKAADLDEAIGWVKQAPFKEEGLVVEVSIKTVEIFLALCLTAWAHTRILTATLTLEARAAVDCELYI